MLFKKTILAIIPVRMGSKRLKLKNIKIFKGKPLFLNTIHLAKKCKYIDEIVVSSENQLITKYFYNIKKVNFRLRPKQIAKDSTKANEVILDVLHNIKRNYDYFIYLQPTSPLRNLYDLEVSLKKIVYKNVKTLFSVSLNSINPNGAIYISKVNHYKKEKKFNNNYFLNYQMPKFRSIDIDNLKDFEKAKKN